VRGCARVCAGVSGGARGWQGVPRVRQGVPGCARGAQADSTHPENPAARGTFNADGTLSSTLLEDAAATCRRFAYRRLAIVRAPLPEPDAADAWVTFQARGAPGARAANAGRRAPAPRLGLAVVRPACEQRGGRLGGGRWRATMWACAALARPAQPLAKTAFSERQTRRPPFRSARNARCVLPKPGARARQAWFRLTNQIGQLGKKPAQEQRLDERSHFRRDAATGRWLYLSGEVSLDGEPKEDSRMPG